MKKLIFAAIALLACASASAMTAQSPNGHISVRNEGNSLVVSHDGTKILEISSLGVAVDGKKLRPNLKKALREERICEEYEMVSGKKLRCHNHANEYAFNMDKIGEMLMRVYNDGVAVRYALKNCKDATVEDLTAYRMSKEQNRWLQKFQESYEDFFPCTSGAAIEQGSWGYPALIQADGDAYALITEADIDRCHSASHLNNEADASDYKVTLADNPAKASGQWQSPWRVAITGKLDEIVESTLVTDLSKPQAIADTSWIQPGVVSWIYWAYNHGSNDYQIVKKYIDMARTLRLPYVLIDAEWDEMSNGGNIDDAIAYALEQGVKPMIWYNSSTAWLKEWGAPGPHNRLNDPEKREAEFAKIAKMGVAGVKIDFFSGDTQPTMAYCIDLLESAARHGLLVNFHGATIPRGWMRTYPNLLSTEAVYGAEWYNNAPTLTNRAAAHNATLPFTRNVVGSMDYTPCTFSDSQHRHITTHGHELALTVLFESGLQHLADKPESYLAQPQEVQNFFSQLPAVWDETRLLGGYPADYAAIARRSGNRWYVGIINGTDQPRTVEVDWSRILDNCTPRQYTAYADHPQRDGKWRIVATCDTLPAEIALKPRGGQVLVADACECEE